MSTWGREGKGQREMQKTHLKVSRIYYAINPSPTLAIFLNENSFVPSPAWPADLVHIARLKLKKLKSRVFFTTY